MKNKEVREILGWFFLLASSMVLLFSIVIAGTFFLEIVDKEGDLSQSKNEWSLPLWYAFICVWVSRGLRYLSIALIDD